MPLTNDRLAQFGLGDPARVRELPVLAIRFGLNAGVTEREMLTAGQRTTNPPPPGLLYLEMARAPAPTDGAGGGGARFIQLLVFDSRHTLSHSLVRLERRPELAETVALLVAPDTTTMWMGALGDLPSDFAPWPHVDGLDGAPPVDGTTTTTTTTTIDDGVVDQPNGGAVVNASTTTDGDDHDGAESFASEEHHHGDEDDDDGASEDGVVHVVAAEEVSSGSDATPLQTFVPTDADHHDVDAHDDDCFAAVANASADSMAVHPPSPGASAALLMLVDPMTTASAADPFLRRYWRDVKLYPGRFVVFVSPPPSRPAGAAASLIGGGITTIFTAKPYAYEPEPLHYVPRPLAAIAAAPSPVAAAAPVVGLRPEVPTAGVAAGAVAPPATSSGDRASAPNKSADLPASPATTVGVIADAASRHRQQQQPAAPSPCPAPTRVFTFQHTPFAAVERVAPTALADGELYSVARGMCHKFGWAVDDQQTPLPPPPLPPPVSSGPPLPVAMAHPPMATPSMPLHTSTGLAASPRLVALPMQHQHQHQQQQQLQQQQFPYQAMGSHPSIAIGRSPHASAGTSPMLAAAGGPAPFYAATANGPPAFAPPYDARAALPQSRRRESTTTTFSGSDSNYAPPSPIAPTCDEGTGDYLQQQQQFPSTPGVGGAPPPTIQRAARRQTMCALVDFPTGGRKRCFVDTAAIPGGLPPAVGDAVTVRMPRGGTRVGRVQSLASWSMRKAGGLVNVGIVEAIGGVVEGSSAPGMTLVPGGGGGGAPMLQPAGSSSSSSSFVAGGAMTAALTRPTRQHFASGAAGGVGGAGGGHRGGPMTPVQGAPEGTSVRWSQF